ncbi:MAG: flavin reductase family protein [Chloroflexota bacterium]
MTVAPDQLRTVMHLWATGVTLVTSHDQGKPHGMTVSSFTSISLSPPLILVSLEKSSQTHRLISQSGVFAVSILHESQADLADRFAGRIPDHADRFEDVPYTTAETGSPIPDSCLAYLDCRLVASHPAGTHTLFIGEVASAAVRQESRPLLYFRRGYRHLAE